MLARFAAKSQAARATLPTLLVARASTVATSKFEQNQNGNRKGNGDAGAGSHGWERLAVTAAGGMFAAMVGNLWFNQNTIHAEPQQKQPPQQQPQPPPQQQQAKPNQTSISKLHADLLAREYPKWHQTDKSSRIDPKTKVGHFKYIIIGAGQSARAALETLHSDQTETQDKILMVGAESRVNSVVTSPKEIEELKRIDSDSRTTLLLGQTVNKLDVYNKLVQLDDGRVLSYDKVLIGTGGAHAATLPGVSSEAKSHVFEFRTLRDIEKLESNVRNENIKHVTVIGGGWLGTEVALEMQYRGRLHGRDLQVTQLYAEPGVLYHVLPEYFRAYLTARLRDIGIVQKNFTLANHVDYDSATKKVIIESESWEKGNLSTDLVVFAPTNVSANTALAEESGLEIDLQNGGIVVNRELMAATDVYAAGDVVSYPNVVLNRRRDQTYDHAIVSGTVAAHNMLGANLPYFHIPVRRANLSLLGLSIDSVGLIDSRLETVAFWDASRRRESESSLAAGKYEKGVIYYLNNGHIVGVMLVNIDAAGMIDSMDAIEAARDILYDQVDYSGVDSVESELRELLPHKPFVQTIVKHTNPRAIIRDVMHGISPSGPKNVFKVRRTLLADAKVK